MFSPLYYAPGPASKVNANGTTSDSPRAGLLTPSLTAPPPSPPNRYIP